ncbi:MAG: collagen-binding protein [Bacteroidetes bacterium GWF2_33_16]|nr:MAG: collagen-binding protein [Bacteroidetes bacterium GWE2_32_14]OFY08860.1 MAG: collagen-binding protein [Bacteroidetes bacterium GWF2_33_16]
MKNILIPFLFFLISLNLNGQKKYTISGHITDHSGEELIGATVYAKTLRTGTATNTYGFYSLTLPEGEYEFEFAYLGMLSQVKSIKLDQNTTINIQLNEVEKVIEEVVITAERKNENVLRTEMSTIKLQAKEIKQVPALFGEVDVIKTLQLLPGIQATGEGFSGFNVRGGSPDQNLILFDEATVYNASHLMGFFSVFNNDAVKDVKVYKGDIPAEYGGRLSSLLDIRMKEGNMKKFEGTGGLGTISSRLTFEGPIIEDKWSFLIAGRRTYADLFLLLSSDEMINSNKLYFYDLNLKTNYKISEKDRLFVSGYFGRDVFKFSDMFSWDWGNYTLTTRWNHLFSERLFSNFSFIYSKYDYKMESGDNQYGFKWVSDLEDFKIKGDLTYFLNPNNTIKFGFDGIFHHFNPGYASGPSGDPIEMPKSNALEYAIYLSNEHKLGSNLTINYGLRASVFQNMGEATSYNFNENYEKIDSTVYEQWDIFNTFYGLEPRLSINYLLNEKSSIKASYSRTKQYVHLASNSTAGSPLDVWVPSSPNIDPQIANQVAIGYFRNYFDNLFETSIELYYKDMNNQIDFKDHAVLTLNAELEGEFRIGDARSYGAEFLIRKQQGKFTGWISYTLSKAEREIPEINLGKIYPSSYDRPHNLAIVGIYDLTKRWNISATWVYSTGNPVTFPSGKYEYEGMAVPIFTDRNSYRMPDYHRLDLSITLKGKIKPNKRRRSELNVSVYNVYNRHNAWMITFTQDPENPSVTKAEKVYVFPIIPSLTWNFYF